MLSLKICQLVKKAYLILTINAFSVCEFMISNCESVFHEKKECSQVNSICPLVQKICPQVKKICPYVKKGYPEVKSVILSKSNISTCEESTFPSA